MIRHEEIGFTYRNRCNRLESQRFQGQDRKENTGNEKERYGRQRSKEAQRLDI